MADKEEQKPDPFKAFRDAGLSDRAIKRLSVFAETQISTQIPILKGESVTDYKQRIKPAVDAKTRGILKNAVGQFQTITQQGIPPPTPPAGPGFPGIVQLLRGREIPGPVPPIPGPLPPGVPGIPVGVPPPPGGFQPAPAGAPAPEAGAVAPPILPPGAQPLAPVPLTPDQAGPPLPTTPITGLPPLPGLEAQPPVGPAGLPPGLPPLPPLPGVEPLPAPTATPSAIRLQQTLVPTATPQEAQDIQDALTEIEGGDSDLFALEELPPLP